MLARLKFVGKHIRRTPRKNLENLGDQRVAGEEQAGLASPAVCRMDCPTLADLELGRVLGRGVSGRVLRVRDRRTAATYALKTIEKSHIKGEAQLTNLYREKELLGALHHPAIVRFHVTLKDEARLYFLLEQLEGGELLWHMRRAPHGRLPEEAARRCLGALLLPLRYMQVRAWRAPPRMLTASTTYGCSLNRLRLQPPSHTVAGSGCALPRPEADQRALQPRRHPQARRP